MEQDMNWQLRSKSMSGKDLVQLLRKFGWTLEYIRGSHHVLSKGTQKIVVPVHGAKDLGKGLLHKILKQAGIET
jgi:predicted RNA binding protein YcfA (HicA-like mRNA interferase family)